LILQGRKRELADLLAVACDLWQPTQYIFVECKKRRKVANPAVDQLAGRLSPNRGMCGSDRREVIIPLSDLDLLLG
jgi:hypothetical protein